MGDDQKKKGFPTVGALGTGSDINRNTAKRL